MIAGTFKSKDDTAICDQRLLEDQDKAAFPKHWPEVEYGLKQSLTYPCQEEVRPDDLDESMWEFLDF
jgi:hypothetical protein